MQIQASIEKSAPPRQAIASQSSSALAQKVDGEENPIAVIDYNKFNEVQRHLAITRHIYNNMIYTIGVNAWKKLTPAQQTIFREESTAAGDLMRKLMAEGETDQIMKLGAAGMQITRPDLAPFRALMEPAYRRIADYAGADNVKRFRDMVDQARKG